MGAETHVARNIPGELSVLFTKAQETYGTQRDAANEVLGFIGDRIDILRKNMSDSDDAYGLSFLKEYRKFFKANGVYADTTIRDNVLKSMAMMTATLCVRTPSLASQRSMAKMLTSMTRECSTDFQDTLINAICDVVESSPTISRKGIDISSRHALVLEAINFAIMPAGR